MKRVIFNQKGGVGKTSITCNLAAAMAKSKKKVLVIDLDSQGNSTQYLAGNDIQIDRSISDFFASTLKMNLFKSSLSSAVLSTDFDNLWLVPADPMLSELQTKLEGRYKIFKLQQAVDQLITEMGFDEVLIDTPPALNFFTMSAFITADRVLIPFDCDAFSTSALMKVVETVEEVAEDHNPNLVVEGVIINQFQAQAKLPHDTVNALLSSGLNVLTPYLSSSVVMKESHSECTPLAFYRPQHKLSKEFIELANNIAGSKKTKLQSAKITRDMGEKTVEQ